MENIKKDSRSKSNVCRTRRWLNPNNGCNIYRVVETGEATEDIYNEMCYIENSTREKVNGFIERAPKYDGNPEIMFEWCKNLETHLLKDG